MRDAHGPTIASMTSIPLSACIITFNEADRIGACLDSLAFCDDIVVVDSGSTDGTADLARACGARVIDRAFTGFRSQKDFAVSQARHDWVLCLDADERIDATLRQAIQTAHAKGFPGMAGYRFARLSEYFGKFLRHGNAYPDRVLRLFDRRHGGWRGKREIHEAVSVDGAIGRLPGNLEHHPYRSLAEQLGKQERYAQMMAEHLFAAGKRANVGQILFSPAWRFLRGYVFRAGFLDGWRGLLYALVRIEYVRRKFIKLWLLQHGYRP